MIFAAELSEMIDGLLRLTHRQLSHGACAVCTELGGCRLTTTGGHGIIIRLFVTLIFKM